MSYGTMPVTETENRLVVRTETELDAHSFR
jgi:hypothetical protein